MAKLEGDDEDGSLFVMTGQRRQRAEDFTIFIVIRHQLKVVFLGIFHSNIAGSIFQSEIEGQTNVNETYFEWNWDIYCIRMTLIEWKRVFLIENLSFTSASAMAKLEWRHIVFPRNWEYQKCPKYSFWTLQLSPAVVQYYCFSDFRSQTWKLYFKYAKICSSTAVCRRFKYVSPFEWHDTRQSAEHEVQYIPIVAIHELCWQLSAI